MGRFIFLINGQYFRFATRSDSPKFASGNRYDGKEIILKAIASTLPAWVGAEQKRPITVNGDQMVCQAKSSVGVTSELTCKHVSQSLVKCF
jgi:hypothetical protein